MVDPVVEKASAGQGLPMQAKYITRGTLVPTQHYKNPQEHPH